MTLLLMTTSSGALSSDTFSSDAFSFNINSFALWLVQPEPLWIRLWLWSCTLEQTFSISNWQFLIPCYHQNLESDFAKHPLFQHTMSRAQICTLIARFSHAQTDFIRMQVDKAHVAVPNWPTEDFQEACLSDPCTLKRAGTNSTQLKEFFFSFSPTYHFCYTFSGF